MSVHALSITAAESIFLLPVSLIVVFKSQDKKKNKQKKMHGALAFQHAAFIGSVFMF